MRDRVVELRRVRADALVPHPENWRKHPDRQKAIMNDVLEEVGMADAVLARELEDGRLQIIDGHLRADIAGDTEVPVLVLDVDEQDARKLLLSIDPLAALAATAGDKLAELAASIDPETGGLRSLIDQLLGPGASARERLDDTETTPETPITKPGDLWLLGRHRLLCGDATNPEHLERLMNGDRASMVFTDPPYGLDKPIIGDDLKRDDLAKMLVDALTLQARHTEDTGAFYVWHGASTAHEFVWALTAAGLEPRETIIWVKPAAVLSWADYLWAHEPCFYAGKNGHRPLFHGPRGEATVWRIAPSSSDEVAATLGHGLLVTDGAGHELHLAPSAPKGRKVRHLRVDDRALRLTTDGGNVWEVGRDTAKPEHPTQKPVELARRAIVNSSRAGEIVLDTFMGSGTTLLGAEITERRGYGLELDPRFADVVCRRWQKATGQQPVLERTGEPTSFLEEDR